MVQWGFHNDSVLFLFSMMGMAYNSENPQIHTVLQAAVIYS